MSFTFRTHSKLYLSRKIEKDHSKILGIKELTNFFVEDWHEDVDNPANKQEGEAEHDVKLKQNVFPGPHVRQQDAKLFE